MITHNGNLLMTRKEVIKLFKKYPKASILYLCSDGKEYEFLHEAKDHALSIPDLRIVVLDKDWEMPKLLDSHESWMDHARNNPKRKKIS